MRSFIYRKWWFSTSILVGRRVNHEFTTAYSSHSLVIYLQLRILCNLFSYKLSVRSVVYPPLGNHWFWFLIHDWWIVLGFQPWLIWVQYCFSHERACAMVKPLTQSTQKPMNLVSLTMKHGDTLDIIGGLGPGIWRWQGCGSGTNSAQLWESWSLSRREILDGNKHIDAGLYVSYSQRYWSWKSCHQDLSIIPFAPVEAMSLEQHAANWCKHILHAPFFGCKRTPFCSDMWPDMGKQPGIPCYKNTGSYGCGILNPTTHVRPISIILKMLLISTWKLFDCFQDPKSSPALAMIAPNAAGSCEGNPHHCYETVCYALAPLKLQESPKISQFQGSHINLGGCRIQQLHHDNLAHGLEAIAVA